MKIGIGLPPFKTRPLLAARRIDGRAPLVTAGLIRGAGMAPLPLENIARSAERNRAQVVDSIVTTTSSF